MMPRKKPKIEMLALDHRLNGPEAKVSCSVEERAKILSFNEAAKTHKRPSGSPVARLVDSGKIGPEELQAAQEIERAFMALAGGLFMRPQNLERVDVGRGQQDWPAALAHAVNRYQEWATHWSTLRKQKLDHTLEITIAAVIDERHIDAIAQDMGFHARSITAAIRAGLRDYAVRAGWLSGTQKNGES